MVRIADVEVAALGVEHEPQVGHRREHGVDAGVRFAQRQRCGLALGDVLDLRDDAGDPALLVAQRARHHHDPDVLARLALQALLVAVPRQPARHGGRQQFEVPRAIVGMRDRHVVELLKFLCGVAHHGQEGRIGVNARAASVGQRHADRRGVENGAELRLQAVPLGLGRAAQAGQHLPERLSQNSDLAARRRRHRDHRQVGRLRRNALRLGRQRSDRFGDPPRGEDAQQHQRHDARQPQGQVLRLQPAECLLGAAAVGLHLQRQAELVQRRGQLERHVDAGCAVCEARRWRHRGG